MFARFADACFEVVYRTTSCVFWFLALLVCVAPDEQFRHAQVQRQATASFSAVTIVEDLRCARPPD